MSTSSKRLPVINDNCALRRNVRVQPYGRCSVCSLHLRQCYAWQSSAMSFGLVVLLVLPMVLTDSIGVRGAMLLALAVLVAQGLVNHRRTDELIFGAHRLAKTNAQLEDVRRGLAAEVAARTASLREANLALARANLELVEAAREREQMVLDVSHDLRTPLTSVKGAAQNLLDGIAGQLGRDQREYVEIVREHADRLIASIGTLLDRARSRVAPIALETARVDLDALARDVARGLQPLADQRAIGLETVGAPAPIVADAAKLRAALENLIGNALKFTEPGGKIVVEMRDVADAVLLTVRDTGVGISETDLDRIFDRFHRASADRPGTGLGLSIVRDVVRLHEGEINVRSKRGRGSEFEISLPRRAA
jgi:signal transduction histidine kinase